MQHVKKVFEREIDGNAVEIILDTVDLEIGDDLEVEARRTAAQMGLVSDLIGEWRYTASMADAGYRQWRGSQTVAVAQSMTRASEWKVKATVEGSKGFVQHKEHIAEAEADLQWLQGYYESLRTKSYLIRSLMELLRQEGRHVDNKAK